MLGLGSFIKRKMRNSEYKKRDIVVNRIDLVNKNFNAEPGVRLGEVAVEENVSMGKNSYMISGRIYSDVKIGRYCSIAANVAIGGFEHPLQWLSTSPFQYLKNKDYIKEKTKITNIGNDVWIGANAYIKSGIKIGDGAVIGSGAVVNKDVLPYSIMVGVPAKLLRYRFESIVINKMLDLKWWELNQEFIETLPFQDIKACIKLIENYKKQY